MRSERRLVRAIRYRRTLFLLDRSDFIPVVAVLWPKEKARHFLEWAMTAKVPGYPNPRSDDAVAGTWMRFTHQDVYVTYPSLVQHPDDVDPVKDGHHRAGYGRDPSRVARAFCNTDPLSIEWSL
ncbi:MAG: hypothetical protein KatS3mg015_2554 [Fimbriimonadales bacterium]|nr:MAG: hypothetical protein KatS3mg015_2554 [Fimbriimonadales bacterium]